ncbi:MAG: RNA polymerase factor sigma-32 [Deltaproteobacteria bacterium]|nr:RNA polymerase factor sigma-32 [Deltaproteobacteria bacterium]
MVKKQKVKKVKAKKVKAEIEHDDSVSQIDVLENEEALKISNKKNDSLDRISGITSYDPLTAFLSELKRYPLLNPEEEKSLAEEYQRTGDVKAAATLVTSNLRLVVKIAFEYRRAYRNIMDLIQEGNVGLMHAVKKYDPAQGVKLSSYAAWWIRAYILRFVLSNWRLVKLGTTQAQRKLFFNLNKEKQRLQSMGIEPSTEMLADNLSVKPKEIIEMERRMAQEDQSLDVEVGDSSGRNVTKGDLLPSPLLAPDDTLSMAMFKDDLKYYLDDFAVTLKGKEKVVFQERLISDSPKTLQEIGDHFNVSRERIRQIEKRVMLELRKYLEIHMTEYFEDGVGGV